MIRLVLFDAMHTLLTTAVSVGERYSAVFATHIGVFEPAVVDDAFSHAIERVKQQQPLLRAQDTTAWWQLVIKQTAVDSGADPERVDSAMPQMYDDLMAAYKNTETAYKLYDDVKPALRKLMDMQVRTGVVTNTDSRIRTALHDLGIVSYLDPIIVSQEEGVEKPNAEIWRRAVERAGNIPFANVVHVGDHRDRYAKLSSFVNRPDTVRSDFEGANAAGLHALLLTRGAAASADSNIVRDLHAVVSWVERHNREQ
ncbi:HAD-like protein [Exidia glandulosa HHB12029]|uniref:HAD-like protein n=1 Tax=Exidia glandulosa HHB12029 TaxID=1314781 RepID=A0A165JNT8_EXIGL|nr:HAD-like protein [Exidia glandulosa HHB12029]